METNICWAQDADSGPAGLCSYSWVCVRAVRDSWLIHLALLSVLCCGVQSCEQVSHARESVRVKASRECPVNLWGLHDALLPAPHPQCVCGVFWLCTGALSKYMLYVTYICYFCFFFFSFYWQILAGHKAYCLLHETETCLNSSHLEMFLKLLKNPILNPHRNFLKMFAETFVLYMSISHCSILRWNHLNFQYYYFYSIPLLC